MCKMFLSNQINNVYFRYSCQLAKNTATLNFQCLREMHFIHIVKITLQISGARKSKFLNNQVWKLAFDCIFFSINAFPPNR